MELLTATLDIYFMTSIKKKNIYIYRMYFSVENIYNVTYLRAHTYIRRGFVKSNIYFIIWP
jgi:hypothetical protein